MFTVDVKQQFNNSSWSKNYDYILSDIIDLKFCYLMTFLILFLSVTGVDTSSLYSSCISTETIEKMTADDDLTVSKAL